MDQSHQISDFVSLIYDYFFTFCSLTGIRSLTQMKITQFNSHLNLNLNNYDSFALRIAGIKREYHLEYFTW